MVMKCADLGHLAGSHDVHLRWVHLLEEEMFRQGDRERVCGYTLSPLMDRAKTGITKSQPGVRGRGGGGGRTKEGTCSAMREEGGWDERDAGLEYRKVPDPL